MHLKDLMQLTPGQVKLWTCAHMYMQAHLTRPTLKDLVEESGFSERTVMRHLKVLLQKGWLLKDHRKKVYISVRPRLKTEDDDAYEQYVKNVHKRYSIDLPPRQGSFEEARSNDMSKLTPGKRRSTHGLFPISSVLDGLFDRFDTGIGIPGDTPSLTSQGIPDGSGDNFDRMICMESEVLSGYINTLEEKDLDVVISKGLEWGLKVGRWNKKQLAYGIVRAIQEGARHPMSYALAVARSSREDFRLGVN